MATVLAGAGAAATSTLLGGQLGVAGTVIGAALASIITTLALNLYDNALRRATHRLKYVAVRVRNPKVAAGIRTGATVAPGGPDSTGPLWTRVKVSRKLIGWTMVTALIGTVLGLGIMVGIERSTAAAITPGTSELAGTSQRNATRTDTTTSNGGTGTTPGGTATTGTDTTGGTTTAGEATPSPALSAIPTSVPSPSVAASTGPGTGTSSTAPAPAASTGTSSGSTGTSSGSTGTIGGTTTGGTTTGGTTTGGTTPGGTTGSTTP
ncbi:hypothetical protein GA0111570_105260 [Raineyella antarctica]|uniref:Uncharacterized protein n=1 Tax=Raineyella antarctica TaxID=1577474 RepID=A0A1G6GY23_9ACTN|nr:hypothetical protein [Raineyella antarctica]SDB86813.1 hypothetical protein GA0111570_105260 [Raineyella antarctica]